MSPDEVPAPEIGGHVLARGNMRGEPDWSHDGQPWVVTGPTCPLSVWIWWPRAHRYERRGGWQELRIGDPRREFVLSRAVVALAPTFTASIRAAGHCEAPGCDDGPACACPCGDCREAVTGLR